MADEQSIIPAEPIEHRIIVLRGQRVMLDADLAALYGVETKNLNLAVRRNKERFPEDFMFRLTDEEFTILRLQSATSRWGGRRYPPLAFTEQGVAMLSSVLRSPQAVLVNVEIMRAFVRLRGLLGAQAEVARRLAELEEKVGEHDEELNVLFKALWQIVFPPALPEGKQKARMGFKAAKDEPDAKPEKARTK